MKRLLDTAIALALCAFTGQASVTVSWSWHGGGGNPSNVSASAVELPASSGNWYVTLASSDNASDVDFVVTGSTLDTIQSITINNSSLRFSHLFVQGVGIGTGVGSVQAITTQNPTTSGGVIIESLRTQGNLGSVSAHIIQSAQIGGSVTGSITCLASDDTHSVQYPRIQSMSVAGNFLGNITAYTGALSKKGRIASLTVGGNIGTAGSPSNISVTGTIGSISANAIYANFDVAPTDATEGILRNIATTNGPFSGSLHARALYNAGIGFGATGIFVSGGDLDADVYIGNAVESTSQIKVLSSGKAFLAGRTMSFDATYPNSMEFANDGLKGQVVFNAAALTSPPYNQWSTTVKENGITLSPTPSYSAGSTSLGGGAVGLVPFRIHATDSEPDQGSYWTADTFPSTVHVNHYGPIEIVGASPPVTIERQEYGLYPPPAWTSVDATKFAYAAAGPNNRDLVITPNPNWFGCGYNYRIKPVAGRLKCRDIPSDGAEADVYAWEYDFSIECAIGDLNLNGHVQLDDASIWLADPVDVDRDGVTDASDLLVILDNLEP